MQDTKSQTIQIAVFSIFVGLLVLFITIIYSRYYYISLSQHIPNTYEKNKNNIQNWMTIHYIARIYNIPEKPILFALHMNSAQSHYKSISAIAHDEHKSTTQIIKTIQKVIHQYHEMQIIKPTQ